MRINKHFLIALLGLATVSSGFSQTILEENFETGNTGNALTPVTVGSGWTVVNGYKGTNPKYNWHNYYSKPSDDGSSSWLGGSCSASVDCPIIYDQDGSGPREEMLISPELNLNADYQLQFSFKVSPMNAYDRSKYDIQVRVIENDNINGAETVFSIQNEKMMREAGISVFPITTWDPYTARVDLSDYKGSKVKLAFVYKMFTEEANSVWIDDISVKKFTPPTGPQPELSLTRNNFGQLYIGEKLWSEPIRLTNKGKDGLKITDVVLPEGIGTNLDYKNVDLLMNQYVDFNINYSATITSPASGKITFKTTGGDISIDYSATKKMVPDGYYLETFEDYFPPAGWTATDWSWTTNAFEGDHSVYCSGSYGKSYLRSPRIDLTEGGKVYFRYYCYFDDDEAIYPEYDIELQVSYDGGDSWVTKWVSPYETGLNEYVDQEVDLGYGDDNCCIRWYYPAVETDDEGAAPHSTFTMDRVLLPNLYGADGTPLRTTLVSPATRSENIYNRNVKLEWGPAQFADGYKVYVGTSSACNELVDGVDVGKVFSYIIPECANDTEYRWKVIGYNDKGDAKEASTWFFKTQPDATVSSFPYEENFLKEELPTGWISTPSTEYSRTWSINTLKKYSDAHGEYGSLATYWLVAGDSNSVSTPDFQLPADKNMYVSFIWGDEHPASLVVDQTGLSKKQNITPNNGISQCDFEIYADGKWNKLTTISEGYNEDGDTKYWRHEKLDLSAYKGKKVQFRWTHYSYSGRDNGAAVTHVILDEAVGDMAAFNRPEWKAGKVNYNKAINSGDIFTLLNQGTNSLKIKSVSFTTPNFKTSLKAGDVIPAGDGLQFNIQFDALETHSEVDDNMVVSFESGYSVEFPVNGIALDKGIYYYSFEPNPLDYEWDKDWTMIDVDGKPGYSFSSYWIYYSADGMRCAFSVESDSKEKGLYGMMNPISGDHALVGSSPQAGSADNWIISKKVKALPTSKFDFYARNWETLQSVLPDPKHHVTVLVSTAGNTDTKDFTPVMRDTEMPFLDGAQWNHYTVDLSDYAGKDIYIALRHTTFGESNLAFFDDFSIIGVDDYTGDGVDSITADDITADSLVEVYNYAGAKVAEGFGKGVIESLERGFYIVKVTDGNAAKSFRLAR